MSEILENEFEEYVTFSVTNSAGDIVEMAVVDEFEFEKKNYVAASLIEDDTIDGDSVYIYRVKLDGEDFTVEKITDKEEYEKVCKAYLEL